MVLGQTAGGAPASEHTNCTPSARTRHSSTASLLTAVGTACVLVLTGCGGGSSSGTRGGGVDVRPVWPQPGGDQTSAQLPPAAQTVRVVFDSNAGQHCCIAISPGTVPIDPASGLRLLLLDQLPPGPATFTLSAYPTDFAPAPPGVTDICPTNPPNIGQECDPTRPATASFESPPQPVTIIAGGRAQPVDIGLAAVPFLFDLQPAPGDSVTSPVPVSFTAADAVTGIDGPSITVEASFRTVTKRVAVTLSPCDDMTDSPCSDRGQLQVTGFHVVGTPVFIPPGPASLRITGHNLASPPRELDFSYDFGVLPTATPAAAPESQTFTPSARPASVAAAGGTQAATQPADRSDGGSAPSSRSALPTRTATRTPATRSRAGVPTETSTPTPNAGTERYR